MKKKKKLFLCVFLVLSVSFLWIGKKVTDAMSGGSKEGTVIVIDAGHGGPDPGKVGINGALEKDINLAIAGYVRDYLQQNGIRVVMTRKSDRPLCQSEESYHKVEDLKNRLALIDTSDACLAVSIHQNSYPAESVHGAQVFYYKESGEGKIAALIMQKQLGIGLKEEKPRVAKANDSYYLLKKSVTPTIIVECGFLSNRSEADHLTEEEYQKKVAWNISIGILQYISGGKSVPVI